jgi:hypothetical protein
MDIRSTTSVSPGITAGNMLHPVTPSRNVPDERNTSLANSHFMAFAALSAAFTGYEAFKVVQEPCVGLTFPHERALVTKTFS